MTRSKNLNILLVDDDAVDRELFREALLKTSIKCVLNEASGGEEAIRFLENQGGVPALIVLDLNMPLKDGRQTLKEIKASKDFKHIPVVVLSTSNSYFDVLQSYEAGASLFLEKPHDFNDLTDMLLHLLSLTGKYASFVKKN